MPLRMGRALGRFSGPGHSGGVSAPAVPSVDYTTVVRVSSDFEDAGLAGWSAADSTIAQTANPRTGSAGSQAIRVTDTGAHIPCAWYDGSVFTPGAWIYLDAWGCKRNGNTSAQQSATRSYPDSTDLLLPIHGSPTVDVWKHMVTTGHLPSTAEATGRLHLGAGTSATNQYFDFDDLEYGEMAPADLLSELATMTATVTASVRVTIPAVTTALGVIGQAGVACNVDSATTPQNMVLAYFQCDDSTSAVFANPKIVVEKMVNGTWSVIVAAAAITYVPGGCLELRRAGNVYTAYYNGTAVGNATVSDATVIGNTLHGVFKTDSRMLATDFAVVDGAGALIFDRRVAANADDGRWAEADSSINTISQLAFGYGATAQKATNVFTRFLGVTIPKNATIIAAHVEFYAAAAGANATVNANVDAVLAASPAAPTTYAGAEGATRTTAVVAWNAVPAWTAGVRYSTPDLAAVIQELVDQATWASGNAMLIYVEDNGSTATQYTTRPGVNYESSLRTQDAALHVEFTP